MDHVAIMNKKLGLIDHILSGQKTIETRWYKNKIAPYNKIKAGDTVYFKDSGSLVRASAVVAKVEQFVLQTIADSQKIIDLYGSSGLIDNLDNDASHWAVGKKYAILIWLKNVQKLTPFNINKEGFGSGAAWITVNNIDTIRMPSRW